jgi:hypothetical protein
MRLSLLTLLVSSIALAQAPAALGSRPSHFSDKGGLALSNEFQTNIGYLNFGGSGAFTLQLRPSADYFIVDKLSVGGLIGFTLLSGGGSTGKNFEINPRVGFAAPIAEGLSFWPKFGVQLTTGDIAFGPLVAAGLSQTTFGITIDAPVLWHPSEHFFLGAGPKIVAQFVGDAKTTSAVVAVTVGGWL